MKCAKIAVVSLGHYIYFQQFEGLKEELMKKYRVRTVFLKEMQIT